MAEVITVKVESAVDLALYPELRKRCGLSVYELREALVGGKPIYKKTIDNEKFYSGIFDIVRFLDFLENYEITYSLRKNNIEVSRDYLDSITSYLKRIDLDDFR